MMIQELFSNPDKWLKNKFASHAVDKNNYFVIAKDSSAVKWTLWGAFQKCYDNTQLPQYKKLVAAMPPHKRDESIPLTTFNNHDATYEDILQLVKDANV